MALKNAFENVSTEAKQDDIIAAVEAIQVAVEILDNVVAGSEAQVDVVSSALPTGAATDAKQDTIIGHVDGLEGGVGAAADAAATVGSTGSVTAKLRLMTSQLDSIKTAVETIDNVVAGSEAQVDVITLPSIPAGNNNIGDVDIATIAAGDNNIGNVDVVTLPALPAGTNNIGDVDVLTLPALPAGNNNIGDVDIVSLPASTNTIEVVGDAAHDAAAAGNPVLIGAEFDDTTPDSVDEGDVGRLRISANRNLFSTIRDAAGNERGVNVNASNQLLTAEASAASILTAVQLIDDSVFTDDAAFTPATSKVNVSGFQADETATDSVDEGDAGAARMTLDRKQIVTVQPHTAGGWSVFNATSSDGATALTNGAQAVKASAGKVGGWYIYNPNATAQFVLFYNTASGSVTVGTTNPLFMLTIPATSAANLELVCGITFSTAITIAAASTAGGNGAPTTALDVVVLYA